MVEDFSEQPNETVPQASETWGATKAAYAFWDNERVIASKITAAQVPATVQRASKNEVVLAVQDTSEANYSTHEHTEGLGYGDHPDSRVLKFHSLLCVSPEGTPLGLLGQQIWTRDPAELGKRHERRHKEIEAKERARWLWGLETAEHVLPAAMRVVTVGDRESDIYDLFATPRRPGSDLLVRVSREQRRVEHPARYLRPAIEQSPPRGKLKIQVPRRDDRPSREAVLTLRWMSLEFHAPRHHVRRSECAPVRLQVILVQEEHPPTGHAPIRWLLATTLPVLDLEDAVQCIRWYSFRWLIERFHYVLKSGCQVERLELETARRLANALATYSIVAWRLLWLTYEARKNPEAGCDVVLESHEWQSLYARVHKTVELPGQVPTLHEAVRMVARLGGFLGRKHDGEPGVKTIWRGLQRLHDIAETWKMLQSKPKRPKRKRTYG
jgi:hypothetical protein